MKLSFSTKGWHNKSFEEFCNIAKELKFGGIELHNINGELFKNKDGRVSRLRRGGNRKAAL